MESNRNVIWRLVIIGVCLQLLSACAMGEKGASVKNDKIEPLPCIVVLPTKIPYDSSSAHSLRSESLQKGALFLQEQLTSELRSSGVSYVIDPKQLNYRVKDLTDALSASLQLQPQQNDCPYVMISEINRFEQRQGGEFAVDEPASAQFELKLIDSRNSSILWLTTFAETQESLLSNLLSFNKAKSRGFKWITVEELVTRGVREKLNTCTYLY